MITPSDSDFHDAVIRVHILRIDAIIVSHYHNGSDIERQSFTDIDAAMKFAFDIARLYIPHAQEGAGNERTDSHTAATGD